MAREKLVMPWPEPESVYDDDGPAEPATFTVEGHQFYVAATEEDGIHSGRRRFSVKCLTCSELVHPGSTSARAQVQFHLGLS